MNAKILIVGCDKGSWQMRGRQLGEVIGAHCAAKPQPDDWPWPDLIVVVKRAYEPWFKDIKATGKPLVWDVLDFWRQPRDNQKGVDELLRAIEIVEHDLGGVALKIGATEAMAKAIGGVYLPHHCRLGLVPTPPRDRAQVVGYDGSPRYLGTWSPALEQACDRLGLQFVINPEDLRTVDALVAFRGEEWDGAVCRRWKSGVKYVNAIAAGRPILTQGCAAFDEIVPVGDVIEDQAHLLWAIERLVSDTVRERAYQDGLRRASQYTVEAIGERYRALILKTLRRAA